MSFIRVNSFRTNVQRASLMLFGQVVADRPLQPAAAIEQRLKAIERLHPEKPLWLGFHTAEDFDRDAFQFLEPSELSELSQAVAGVRDVAAVITEGSRAHPEQLDRARPHFVRVIELMGYDRYDDGLAYILGKTIERQLAPKRPPHLNHLRFMTGLDSTGDPALWAWAFVDETGEYDTERFLARTDVIEEVLKPIARSHAPEGRVYLRFRSTLDQPEAEGVAA